MRRYTAYVATNMLNNKNYVGVTGTSVEKRWSRHVWDAANGSQCPLHNAIRKYGALAFSVEAVASTKERQDILDAERTLIVQWGSKCPKGYNATDGGEGFSGLDGTSVQKRAATQREAWKDPAVKAKRAAAMRAGITPESIERRAAKRRGVPVSDEERERLSAISKANWERAEFRELRRIAMTGRKLTPEAVDRIAAANKGKVRTSEMKEKYRAVSNARDNHGMWEKHMADPAYAEAWRRGMRGRKHTDDTKAKMRATQLGRKRGQAEIDKQKATVAALSPQAVYARVEKWRATIAVTRDKKAAEKFAQAAYPFLMAALGFGC